MIKAVSPEGVTSRFTYDAIGNPLSDGTWTYAWQHGRQLASMSKSGSSITYGYNADGKRISKMVNGTTYNYAYLGDTLTDLSWGSNQMHFTYDSLGPASVTYNGVKYFYLKNAQGDVTGLVNASGTQVVSYTYDPWGAPMSTGGTMASTLGAANPLRYRGYVYDTETGLYYLSSRYYNPTWGRFINADTADVVTASPDKANWDKNLFAYCDNNPINRQDDEGNLWAELKIADIITHTIVGGIVGAVSGIINRGITGEKITFSSILRDFSSGALSGLASSLMPVLKISGITRMLSEAIGAAASTFIVSAIYGASVEDCIISASTAFLAGLLSHSICNYGAEKLTSIEHGMVDLFSAAPAEATGSAIRAISHAQKKGNSRNRYQYTGGRFQMRRMTV